MLGGDGGGRVAKNGYLSWQGLMCLQWKVIMLTRMTTSLLDLTLLLKHSLKLVQEVKCETDCTMLSWLL